MSLRDEKYINLATFRKNGRSVETPVWFAEAEGKLYVFTAGDSGKVKRLRNSSTVRLAPCDVRGRVHGEWIDADARLVTDPGLIERGWSALRSKYGLVMWITDLASRLTGRLAKRAWIEIELRPGSTTGGAAS